MTKQLFSILAVLSLFIACSTSALKNESGSAVGLNQHAAIQVGALALNTAQWKDLGFKTEEEWTAAIKNINTAFQQKLKELLPQKQLAFADAGKAAKSTLEVALANATVDRGYKIIVGPWGSISASITIKNIKTNAVAYQGDITAKKIGTYSLDEQFQSAACEIAEKLAETLQK